MREGRGVDMTRRTSLYDVLGVAPSATSDEIRGAYRHTARVLHPDAGGSAAAFERLAIAYHVLADPARRAKYDRYLAAGGGTVPAGAASAVAGPAGAGPGSAAGGPRQGSVSTSGGAAGASGREAPAPGRHRPPSGGGNPLTAGFPGVGRSARRGYLVMMALALTLFILAGTIVRGASV